MHMAIEFRGSSQATAELGGPTWQNLANIVTDTFYGYLPAVNSRSNDFVRWITVAGLPKMRYNSDRIVERSLSPQTYQPLRNTAKCRGGYIARTSLVKN